MSVWFGPKVALSELSCSFGPGVTGLLGPNGAGKTTLMRAITGLVGVNQGTVRDRGPRPPPRPGGARRMALVPEDEAVPAGLTAAAVRAATSPTCTASPTASAPDDALRDGRDARRRRPRRRRRSARGCASAPRSPPRSSAIPQVLVLDEPLNGADPGAAGAPHRPVQATRRRGSHRDRQLARAERGRAPGRAGDRPHPRPAGGRRRPPRDPRRDGRSSAARAGAIRRRAAAGRLARRPRIGGRRDVRLRRATAS